MMTAAEAATLKEVLKNDPDNALLEGIYISQLKVTVALKHLKILMSSLNVNLEDISKVMYIKETQY